MSRSLASRSPPTVGVSYSTRHPRPLLHSHRSSNSRLRLDASVFLNGGSAAALRTTHSQSVTPLSSGRMTIYVTCSAGSSPMKVMIAGAPASGKGTQSQKIVEKYGLEHICVGDLLREEIAAGTDAGARAKGYMDRGELVPNEIVVDMVKHSISSDKAQSKGWLLDGYPRSLDQAMAIEEQNIRPDVFLLLNVPNEVLVERVVGRRMDPETGEIYHIKFKPPPEDIAERLIQRFDDTEEKVVNRLNTYHSNLESILDVYKSVIVEIDGEESIDSVFASIEQALSKVAPTLAAEP